MTGYADGELLVAEWLQNQVGAQVTADPDFLQFAPFQEPVGHVQRAPGEGDTVLTLDSMLLDVDWYAELADHARDCAHQTWNLLRLSLPLHTFDNGVFCTGVSTVTAPFWAPATGVYRRSAAYRVILHGLI
jgi:hypothetical protein